MGLQDWFRKPKRTASLPEICYSVAYFVLPHYTFNELTKITDLFVNTSTTAGPYFYIIAALMQKVEPDTEDAKRFHWHHGQLDESREYFALEYPDPPPVDMSDVPVEQIVSGKSTLVLAPYFSAIIRGAGSAEPQYFVLGQAPMGGGTTLRCVLPEGINCNLGPGPEPKLSAFLDAVRERVTKS